MNPISIFISYYLTTVYTVINRETEMKQVMTSFVLHEGNTINEQLLLFQHSMLESELNFHNICQEAILTEATILLENDDDDDDDIAPPTFIENIISFMRKMIVWFKDISKKVFEFISTALGKVLGNFGVLDKGLKAIKNEAMAHLPIIIKTHYPNLQTKKQFEDLHKRFTKDLGNNNITIKGNKGGYGEDILESLDGYKKHLDSLGSTSAHDVTVYGKEVDDIVNTAYKLAIDCKAQATSVVKLCKDGISSSQKSIEQLKKKDFALSSEDLSEERNKISSYRKIIGEIVHLNIRTVRMINSQANKIARVKIQAAVNARKAKREQRKEKKK